MNKVKPAAYLLIKTNLDARKVLKSVGNSSNVKWSNNVYGPYQVVAYAETETYEQLSEFIEDIRSRRYVTELDARMVKTIPKDELLGSVKTTKKQTAVLLVNVNYKEEKERIVTYHLREIKGVKWARAMWGPADIIVIVEADDHESMRNLICDEIKTMKGVLSNTTLYCY